MVRDTVRPVVQHRRQVLPATLRDHLCERYPVADAAPCKNHHVRLCGGHFFRTRVRSRFAQEPSASSLDQLCNLSLRANQRLAPLLTVDERLCIQRRCNGFYC